MTWVGLIKVTASLVIIVGGNTAVGAAVSAQETAGAATHAATQKTTPNVAEATNLAYSTSVWQAHITDRDRMKLRSWYSIWQEAIVDARRKGHSADITRAGVLLQPFAALENPMLPTGVYRCRVIKIGKQAGGSGYASSEWSRCDISPTPPRLVHGLIVPTYQKTLPKKTSFPKTEQHQVYYLRQPVSAQRLGGTIYPDPTQSRRQIFLGTIALSDEVRMLPYGDDLIRDQVGIVERIGESHWRILLPAPIFESRFHIIELFPAP